MKKIARITTQKRSSHRYNVFISDGSGETYGFSVDEDVLVKYNLRKGLTLDDVMINQLKSQDTLHKSYSKVISYLGYRMRTEKEIRDYLVKDEVDEEHIDQIIHMLKERQLLDDQEFAKMFVRSRIQTTLKGPGIVKQELAAKGVAHAYITRATELYTYDVQYQKATKHVEKRLKRQSKDSFVKQLQQIQALLMRNGFEGNIISDVLHDIDNEKDADEEWEAIKNQGERLLLKHQKKQSGYELRQKVKASLYRQGFEEQLIEKFLDQAWEE